MSKKTLSCNAGSAVTAVIRIVGIENGIRDVYVTIQEFSLRFFPQENKKWLFSLARAITKETLKFAFPP